MYLTDEAFEKLKAEQKELREQIKAAKKIESGEDIGGFMGMVKGIADSISLFGGGELPAVFNKVGKLEGVGNFVCKMLTKRDLSEFFNEFKQPGNIAEIKQRLGCDDEAEIASNPLLGLFNQFLDGVAGAKDMQAASIDKNKFEEYEARLEEINERVTDEKNFRNAIRMAEIKAQAEVAAEEAKRKIKAGFAPSDDNQPGAAHLSEVNTTGIAGGQEVNKTEAAPTATVTVGSTERQVG